MKMSRFVVCGALLSAFVATETQAQTVFVAGTKIQLSHAQPAVNLDDEFAALRQSMRAQTPHATMTILSVDGRVSLRSTSTTLARATYDAKVIPAASPR